MTVSMAAGLDSARAVEGFRRGRASLTMGPFTRAVDYELIQFEAERRAIIQRESAKFFSGPANFTGLRSLIADGPP